MVKKIKTTCQYEIRVINWQTHQFHGYIFVFTIGLQFCVSTEKNFLCLVILCEWLSARLLDFVSDFKSVDKLTDIPVSMQITERKIQTSTTTTTTTRWVATIIFPHTEEGMSNLSSNIFLLFYLILSKLYSIRFIWLLTQQMSYQKMSMECNLNTCAVINGAPIWFTKIFFISLVKFSQIAFMLYLFSLFTTYQIRIIPGIIFNPNDTTPNTDADTDTNWNMPN